MHDPQSKQGGEELRGVAQSLTKLPSARVSSLDFRRAIPFDDHECRAKGQLKEQFSLNAFAAVRQPLKQIYRRTETTDRISIPGALPSPDRCHLLRVAHSP